MKWEIWASKNKLETTLLQADSAEHEYLTKGQKLQKEFEAETHEEAREVFRKWNNEHD